jgi:peroxiredoxin family protein
MKSAGIVSVAARKCTTNGPARTLSVLKAVPTSPTVFTATGTNVCNYTQSAFAITGVRDTFRTKAVAGATGYYFETPGGATVQRLNDTTITVVFADTTTATAVKVYSLSSCDTSLAKVIALTRTQLAAPTAITITSVNPNVCGARQYRYSAPALPAGALGYEWSLEGSLGEFASIDSGDINSQKIVVTYASNAAAVAGDSVRLSYTTGCGYSKSKASKMSNTALKAPTAPASITIQSIQTNVCGARKYRYIAPALPAASATAGAATGYVWSFLGSLSSTMTVDSGSLTSRILTVTFTSNAASAAGDSVRVLYTSDCGNSLRKASKLSNLALGVPAAPASITIQSIQTNVCGDRKYRYIAPVLPSATTTAGAASGYVWSFLGSLSSTMTIDSGSLSSRTLTVTYTSNAAAAAGDSVRVLYTSGCGNSLRKASKLSNLALNVPATPASVTIQTKSDVCGARKYRYIAPVLPSATTTAGAASGYLWTLPTGSVGSTGSLDSGSLSGRTIVIVYTSNAAATTDSIRVRYTSGCGNSAIKAQKLSNLVKTCLTSGSEVFSRVAPNVTTEVEMGKVYPNPNNGTFTLQARTGVISKSTATVQVIDMMGKVVSQSLVSMNQGVINTTINNNNLKNGVYMVKYIAGNTTQTIRMVVQK